MKSAPLRVRLGLVPFRSEASLLRYCEHLDGFRATYEQARGGFTFAGFVSISCHFNTGREHRMNLIHGVPTRLAGRPGSHEESQQVELTGIQAVVQSQVPDLAPWQTADPNPIMPLETVSQPPNRGPGSVASTPTAASSSRSQQVEGSVSVPSASAKKRARKAAEAKAATYRDDGSIDLDASTPTYALAVRGKPVVTASICGLPELPSTGQILTTTLSTKGCGGFPDKGRPSPPM